MNEPIRTPPPATGCGGRKSLALVSTVLLLGIALYASRTLVPPAPAIAVEDERKPTASAVVAADAFLEALDVQQRHQAQYEFSSARKSRWSNLPVTFVPRNGVRLGDLTKKQRNLAVAVIAAVLSKGGYQKVVNIMDADQQLADRSGQAGRG